MPNETSTDSYQLAVIYRRMKPHTRHRCADGECCIGGEFSLADDE